MKNITILVSVFVLSLSFLNVNIFAAKKISPMTVEGTKSVTTDEAKKLFDNGALFIDVRSNKAWAAGRIADAVLLDIKSKFSEQNMLAEMKKGDPAVIYCNGETCLRSAKACKKAVGWGFTNIQYYRDGYPAWKKAGYPVE
ncbi:MAG: rhodanese-like domain-containing protein [Pseudomonadota bacterium]